MPFSTRSVTGAGMRASQVFKNQQSCWAACRIGISEKSNRFHLLCQISYWSVNLGSKMYTWAPKFSNFGHICIIRLHFLTKKWWHNAILLLLKRVGDAYDFWLMHVLLTPRSHHFDDATTSLSETSAFSGLCWHNVHSGGQTAAKIPQKGCEEIFSTFSRQTGEKKLQCQ